jgi:hypothetical protein
MDIYRRLEVARWVAFGAMLLDHVGQLEVGRLVVDGGSCGNANVCHLLGVRLCQ